MGKITKLMTIDEEVIRYFQNKEYKFNFSGMVNDLLIAKMREELQPKTNTAQNNKGIVPNTPEMQRVLDLIAKHKNRLEDEGYAYLNEIRRSPLTKHGNLEMCACQMHARVFPKEKYTDELKLALFDVAQALDKRQ